MNAFEELVIGRSGLRALVGSLSSALPVEGCGVVLGRGQGRRAIVHRHRPAANRYEGGRTRHFELCPHDLAAAVAAGRRQALELLGFYHSHPQGPAAPSRLDRLSAWPHTVQIIVGLGAGEPEVRAWVASGSGDAWRPLNLIVKRELAG